jgi:RNA polymerase-binding transcription factor DksA
MDLNAMRERLLVERDRLAQLHKHEMEALDETVSDSELADYDQHPAEAASKTLDQEWELSVIESLEGQLSLIDEALKRIDAGTYGRCEICKRPIGEERLVERPMARFCKKHQEGVEKQVRAENGRTRSSSR